jgi:hypothetical protein
MKELINGLRASGFDVLPLRRYARTGISSIISAEVLHICARNL